MIANAGTDAELAVAAARAGSQPLAEAATGRMVARQRA
jgi:hypothetical protein